MSDRTPLQVSPEFADKLREEFDGENDEERLKNWGRQPHHKYDQTDVDGALLNAVNSVSEAAYHMHNLRRSVNVARGHASSTVSAVTSSQLDWIRNNYEQLMDELDDLGDAITAAETHYYRDQDEDAPDKEAHK